MKLEKLNAFLAKNLNASKMSNIRGGLRAGETITGAGTREVNTVHCATGCISYTSDVLTEGGGTWNNPVDVNP
jgi:hypothetical protein